MKSTLNEELAYARQRAAQVARDREWMEARHVRGDMLNALAIGRLGIELTSLRAYVRELERRKECEGK